MAAQYPNHIALTTLCILQYGQIPPYEFHKEKKGKIEEFEARKRTREEEDMKCAIEAKEKEKKDKEKNGRILSNLSKIQRNKYMF